MLEKIRTRKSVFIGGAVALMMVATVACSSDSKEAGGEALVRRGKGMKWRPLERFGRDFVSPPTSLEELRAWKGALIIGNKAITRFVGDNLRRPVRGRLSPKHNAGRMNLRKTSR